VADTILNTDVTVSYLDESRQAVVSWSGDENTTYSMNQLYSGLMDLFDEPAQSDNPIPMSAQTPTEYTGGKIDAGATDPWYFTYELMEHITGGAMRTASWARVTSSNTGIVVVPVTSNTLNSTDIGDDGITNATGGDVGTLLEIIDDGTNVYLVIRPADDTAANDWDSTSGTINNTGSTRSATQSAASLTGEQIWANFFSLGTIENDTHVFAYAGAAATDGDRVRITSVNSTTEDWWGDGAVDVVIPIRDWKTAGNPVIDAGFVTWKAHKYSTEYSFFEAEASTTSGGRNPVPLSTKNDLNNNTGFRSITFTSSSGNWNVGDEITGDTSGARGIITQIDNPGATQTVYYYLLAQQPSASDHFGGALTDFQTAAENLTNQDDSGTGAKNGSAPSAQGPSLATWFTNNTLPTITFGNYQADIDNDSTNEQYGILIDCNQNPLVEVYEWLKYITRYGATGTGDTDGIAGELYKGGEVYINYGTSTVAGGTISEGDDVTQETSGATGVVVSHDTTSNTILLRDVRGTFATGSATDHTITSTDNSGAVEMETADSAVAETFAPNAVSPYGTLAGGTFFGARGVALTDWLAANENQFQLTPIEGGTKSRPQAFTITVTNVNGTAITDATADLVAVHELTSSGGPINKTQYSSTGGAAVGANTQVVDTSITADTPASDFRIVIRDASDDNENYYIRCASFSGSTFTLAEFSSFTTTATTNTTQVTYSTGGFNANVQRGDLVYNSTRSASSYVVSVDSDTQLTISPAITGQTTGDSVAINVMPIDDDTLDDVYVVPIHTYPTASTASVSLQFVDTYHYRVAVRNNRAATKIIPFTTDGSVTSGTDNQTVQTIRTEDTITS
jgi:hypothetical protein